MATQSFITWRTSNVLGSKLSYAIRYLVTLTASLRVCAYKTSSEWKSSHETISSLLHPSKATEQIFLNLSRAFHCGLSQLCLGTFQGRFWGGELWARGQRRETLDFDCGFIKANPFYKLYTSASALPLAHAFYFQAILPASRLSLGADIPQGSRCCGVLAGVFLLTMASRSWD